MSLSGYVSVKHKFSDSSYWMRFLDFSVEQITSYDVVSLLTFLSVTLNFCYLDLLDALLFFSIKARHYTFKIDPREK